MILLHTTTAHLNYKKLISPATYYQAALLFMAFTLCMQNIKRHLNPRAAARHNSGAFRLYSVKMALQCTREQHSHRTQPQQCRRLFHDMVLHSTADRKFPVYSFYPSSTQGEDMQVTESSTVSRSHRAITSQSRSSKTKKKRLEEFFLD